MIVSAAPRRPVEGPTAARSRISILVALTTVAAACAACANPGATPVPDRPPVTAAPPSPSRSTTDIGAIKDASSRVCKADSKGVWSFSGKIVNGEKRAQRYRLEISVVDPQGWTVKGSKTLQVTVAAGATEAVKADAFFKGGKKSASWQCVTRVTRKPS